MQNLPNRGPIVATLTFDEAREIYEVRGALEGLAARLFAERAGAKHHAALDAAMAALERAFATGDTRAIVKATAQFYDVVLGGCGNDVVRRLINTLLARVT